MRNHYIYAHYRNDDNSVFYVGKGQRRRAWETGAKRRSRLWHNIAKKHGHTVKIWASNLTEEVAFQMERDWIALYGRMDNGTGCLVNHTNGGEGPSGKMISRDTRQKMSNAASNRSMETKQKLAAHGRGHQHSQDAKRRIGAAAKGRKVTAETKMKLRIAAQRWRMAKASEVPNGAG